MLCQYSFSRSLQTSVDSHQEALPLQITAHSFMYEIKSNQIKWIAREDNIILSFS